MQYAEQQDKVMFQELAKLYGETFKDVQKEIFAFYAKYAEDNKITIQEAKQRLRRTDLSDYRENARRYREEAKTPELLERLNEQYVSSKATRLDALKLDLTYQLGLLQGKVSGSFDSYLKKLAKHSYRKISGGLSDSTLNEPALKQLVKTPFKGYNYSQQVWGNVDHLARDLHKTLTRGFVKGFSPHEMATEIRKRHDVAKHRAETLVRTDGSMVINNATLKRYKDVGLKLYRIHVHIDSRTSDICMNISKLDKAYKLSEAQPGYNMPPLHPNCRSTIVPDDADMDRADDRDVEEVRRLLNEEKDTQYRKNSRIGYDSTDITTYARNVGGNLVAGQAKRATGTNNQIYVSNALERKTKAIRFYDNQFTEAYGLIEDIASKFDRPKIVIGSQNEFNKQVLASYMPSENTLYVRGDIKSNEAMKEAQDDSLAMNNHPLSTVIHELGHWYQYQAIKAKHPELSNEEIIKKEMENSAKMIDTLSVDGYNVGEDVSRYAKISNGRNKLYEVYAEAFVKDILSENNFSKYVDLGVN